MWDEPAEVAAHKRHSKSIDSSDGDVPEIWEEKLDSSTGCKYYVDPATGASQWEKPCEGAGEGRKGSGIRVRTISSAQSETEGAAGVRSPAGVRNPWVVRRDEAHNAEYYFNVVTQEA